MHSIYKGWIILQMRHSGGWQAIGDPSSVDAADAPTETIKADTLTALQADIAKRANA